MMRLIVCFILGWLIVYDVSAQKHIKGAVGCWELTGDISVIEAEERALLEAKREALRKAGIEDQVVFSVLGLQQINNERYTSMYNRIGWVETVGLVRVKQKAIRKVYDEKGQRFFIEVTINAVVEKAQQRDPEFRIEIDGLHQTYRAGESLAFTCRGYKDCYLRIFVFDLSKGYMIYPNHYEEDALFRAGDVCEVPQSGQAVYELIKSKGQSCEYNLLLIVATKKKIPFIGEVGYEQVLEWLCRIPVKERTEEWRSFLVE